MKLLIENNRSNSVITPDRSATSSLRDITEQQVNSEMEILSSEDVVASVADPSWDVREPGRVQPVDMKRHDQLVSSFRKHLSIEPAKKSDVIVVEFTAHSSGEATSMLNRFANAYLSERRRLSRPSGTSNFFVEEASKYQIAWQNAERELSDFQKQHQVISIEQEEDALKKQLLGYEDDLRTNQASTVETDTRLVASRRATSEVPARQKTQERTVVNEASSEQMRTLLVQLQNRRTELLTRFTPHDRLVQEVERQIAQTQSALADAIAEPARESTTDVNPAWQQLQNSVADQGVEGQALRSREASLSKTIQVLGSRLIELESLDVEFKSIQEQADQARNNFELFSEKREQAQIEDAMDEHELVNVAVAEKPTATFVPVSPRPSLDVALGTITALFLASAAVYFAELGRSTISSARELESLSRFPVLATVPDERELERSHGPAKSEQETGYRTAESRVAQLTPIVQYFGSSSRS